MKNTIHGYSRRPEYEAWKNMHKRCKSKKYKCHERYRSLGITVCQQWSVFTAFLEDLGDRPSDRHSLDRVDNLKGYEPGNCRWAISETQQRNKENTTITDQQRVEICILLGQGMQQTELSKLFKTSRQNIHGIKRRYFGTGAAHHKAIASTVTPPWKDGDSFKIDNPARMA